MSLRGFAMTFMPDGMKKKVEADSRSWIGLCRKCGAANSIWDVGGIRYKAAGRKRARVKCPKCGEVSFHTFEKVRP